MKTFAATTTLSALTPYSQSRPHREPKLDGELAEDYDMRTWKSHLTVRNGEVCIPAHGMHQALIAGAKYSGLQIPGQGKARWTSKFERGIAIMDDIGLGVSPDDVDFVDIYANADGVRGSGKRVMRRYPIVPSWTATFDVHILDPIITEGIFKQIFEITGIYIGIGRFRAENGGTNGRFRVDGIEWRRDDLLAA